MGRAKDIIVKPIPRKDADKIIKSLHYSGKVVRNSQIHLGVFLDGKCGGVLQFGPSLDKKKIIGLVRDTKWNGFIELNRMALADWLPANGESRSIAVAMKLLKKHYPQLEWVVSFADGTQCGHGTIYQASGFTLTGINQSKNLVRLPNGSTIHKMTLESNPTTPRTELGGKSYYDVTGGRYNLSAYVEEVGGQVIPGFQFRYMYFLNYDARKRLTVPVVPFSKIKEIGGEMYRGEAK
ncbi:hypothetical protein C5Y96_09920 [Blastopirellula marina]|uniref:N-acetyltransferase domain-containing protein n=1 Tax=Blastopirellula marina TaxID=124 RepID=A0A2S8FLY5_9BACT|nr:MULTISPECIES: hypothetical protein [Pirellulaceae]PQO33167.1 hypothetical protein C5Y96_09920 [Blastopirellula marina]RCS52256.1 hypothetical protein DTL36_09930 [Bremerella cremea]